MGTPSSTVKGQVTRLANLDRNSYSGAAAGNLPGGGLDELGLKEFFLKWDFS